VIGLDTNVLVRYIVRDDDEQTETAARLIETQCTHEKPGYISTIVLCELAWVLSRGYKYERQTIAAILRRILSVRELQVQDSEIAWQALNHFENGKADFADYLIGVSNRESKAIVTYTFDKIAAESDLFLLIS
jgi:predicted nucleic-acid-binding protein